MGHPDDFHAYDPMVNALLEKVCPDQHLPADIYRGKKQRPSPRGGTTSTSCCEWLGTGKIDRTPNRPAARRFVNPLLGELPT